MTAGDNHAGLRRAPGGVPRVLSNARSHAKRPYIHRNVDVARLRRFAAAKTLQNGGYADIAGVEGLSNKLLRHMTMPHSLTAAYGNAPLARNLLGIGRDQLTSGSEERQLGGPALARNTRRPLDEAVPR